MTSVLREDPLLNFRRSIRLLAAAGAIFWIAAAAFARQKAPAESVVQERVGVTAIEIPVSVIDKNGRPVAGLAASDFELYDEGKKQEISGFEVIDLNLEAGRKPEAAQEVPPSARRLWLIVFDLSYTSPTGLLRARDGARAFVTGSMKESDLAAVGTLSVDTGWKLLVNFTRDRWQLARAIDTLGLPSLSVRTSDPLAFAFAPPGPSAGGAGTGAGSDKKSLMLDDLKDLQTLQKAANDDLARGRVAKLMNSLAGIGRVLDSVRGRKHVLFFSEGFESRLLSGNMAGGGRSSTGPQPADPSVQSESPADAGNTAVFGEIWKIDSDARFGSSATRSRVDALALFQRSDAVLDAIDISGLRAEGDVGSKPGSGTDALFAIASVTEGDLIRNANQLGGELERLAQQSALVYLLVYQPKGLTKPGAFHALKVKVKSSGAKVLARSGYYEPRPYASLSALEQMLAAGDLVTAGARENGLAGHLLAAPFASAADLAQVPIILEIPGGPLVSGDTGAQTLVQIYAYANDAAGTLADYLAAGLTLDLSKLRKDLEAGGIKFYGTLYLPAGEYGLRALVRNATTGRSGVFSAKFRVPAMPGGPPTVLPPFFPESASRWIMVRGKPRSDAPARPADYPFAVAGESFVPAATPVLSSGQKARVAIVTYNFGVAEKPAPLEVRGEILGADGSKRPAAITVERRSEFERGGGRKLLLTLDPQGLTPGRYVLKLAVSDAAAKKEAESAAAFEVK